jgi:purine-binding chemotaxis protein CheW
MSTYVRVRIGDEVYALPVEHVQEVVRLGLLTPIPGAGASVLGIFNLRGGIVPVFDLAHVLGVAADGARQRVLIVDGNGRPIGFAVDEVSDVTELSDATEPTDSELLCGAALIAGKLVGFIDLPALLATLQRKTGV